MYLFLGRPVQTSIYLIPKARRLCPSLHLCLFSFDSHVMIYDKVVPKVLKNWDT